MALPALVTTLLFASLPLAPQEAMDGPDLLSLIPEDALVVAVTARIDAVRARAADNAWVRFAQDGAFAPLWNMIPVEELEKELPADFDVRAFLDSVHGRMAFFAAPHGPENEIIGAVLLEAGDAEGTFSRMLAELLDAAVDDGFLYPDEHEGIPLWVEVEEEEEGADGTRALVFVAPTLVGLVFGDDEGSTRSFLYELIDRQRGGDTAPGFAASPTYLATHAADRPAPAVEAFVALDRIWAMVGEEMAPGLDDPTWRVLEEFGLTRMKWVHATADVGTGEQFELEMRAHLPADSFLGKVMGCMGPAPVDLMKLLPAETPTVGLMHFDVARCFDLVSEYLRASHEAEYRAMQEGMNNSSLVLGTDVVELLRLFTGRVAVCSVPVPREEFFPELLPEGMEVDPSLLQGPAYVVEVRDAKKLRGIVTSLLNSQGMGSMVEEEEFGGATIHRFDTGPMAIVWAFTANALVVSIYPTPVRAVLRLAAKPDLPSAADDEAYGKALRGLGPVSFVSLSNTRSLVESMLATMGMFGDLGAMMDPTEEWIGGPFSDFELPPEEIAAEYFEGTVVYYFYRRGDVIGLYIGSR